MTEKQTKPNLWVGTVLPVGTALAIVSGLVAVGMSRDKPLAQLLTAPMQTEKVVSLCTEYASKEDAIGLITRWFAEPEFLEFTPLQTGHATCLLEVEMLAQTGNADSLGFIYVLPDGQHALNGPLYDKRSQPQIVIAGEANPMQDAQVQELMAKTEQVLSTLAGRNSQKAELDQRLAQLDAEEHESHVNETDSPYALDKPFIPNPGESVQQALLRELKAAPHATGVQRTVLERPAAQAYVLYDSNCPACTALYQEMEEIASTHKVQFNWVPGYLNNQGWAQAAHTISQLDISNDRGVQSIRENFENEPKSLQQVQAMTEGMDDSYYEKAKIATAFLLRLNKMSPRVLGTPLIFVEGPSGNVTSAYGAVTDLDEWAELVQKAQ